MGMFRVMMLIKETGEREFEIKNSFIQLGSKFVPISKLNDSVVDNEISINSLKKLPISDTRITLPKGNQTIKGVVSHVKVEKRGLNA